MKNLILILICSLITFSNAKIIEKSEVIINFSENINYKNLKVKSYNKFIKRFNYLNYNLGSYISNNIILSQLNIVDINDKNYEFNIANVLYSFKKNEIIVTYFELYFAYGQRTIHSPLKVIMHNIYITGEDFDFYLRYL